MPKKLRLVTIRKSHRKEKKFDAVFEKNGRKKVVPFGQKGYSDFTKHKNKTRRARYLHRHAGMGEHWNRPDTPGALSRWVLWNKPTLKGSVADFKKRFQLGGDMDVEKTLETQQGIPIHKRPVDEYMKIASELNNDVRFSSKYTAVFDDKVLKIEGNDDVPRAWIYNTNNTGYMLLNVDVEYTRDQIDDMAFIYRKFLEG